MSNSGLAKLLGIYYGPQLSSTERIQHLLADMQTLCSLCAHRARTLRGQVIILRRIILSLLWISASVFYIPATGFQDQVTTLISRFLYRRSSLKFRGFGSFGEGYDTQFAGSYAVHANIGCPYTFSQRYSHLGEIYNSTIRPYHFPIGPGS